MLIGIGAVEMPGCWSQELDTCLYNGDEPATGPSDYPNCAALRAQWWSMTEDQRNQVFDMNVYCSEKKPWLLLGATALAAVIVGVIITKKRLV